MFPWPSLELTDYERKFVRIYKTKDYPGVLNRVYKVTLNDPAQPTKNLPIVKLSGQIQIARRSRVYGISFLGNLDRWRLNISNASGTLYTTKTPRTQLDPVVSSLLPCSQYNAISLGGLVPPLTFTNLSDGVGPGINPDGQIVNASAPFPLIIEPNWLLLPNETLIFNGTPLNVSVLMNNKEPAFPPLTLNIAVHVWEFPGMGTADIQTREIL